MDGFVAPPPQVLAIVQKAREVMGGAAHVTYTWRGFPESNTDRIVRVSMELSLSIKEKSD